MGNIRHTAVVRKDLQLSTGLLAAQVAHISDQFIRSKLLNYKAIEKPYPFTEIETQWLKDPYLSVLAVNCAEDLNFIQQQAIANKLQVCEWFDTIPSPTFPDRAIRVLVGISIGPDDFDKIKVVTGALPLY